MKKKLFRLGVCSLIIFSCNKKTEKNISKISDSITIKSSDTISANKTDIVSVKRDSVDGFFTLIKKDTGSIPGPVNKSEIDKLSEPLRAIAALYSGLAGSNCSNGNCELTIALGLGKQGSKLQIDLVKKWFPKDKVAEQLISQNFYQPPNTSSSFSDLKFLTFEKKGNIVIVNYDLFIYNHGEESNISGPDKFIIKGNTIETINRNIWKDTK
jgi:hypothetical protein